MKLIAFFLVLAAIVGCAPEKPGKKQGYGYEVSLGDIADDRIPVVLDFEGELTDTAYFCLPKIVPGIYDDLDFGKQVSELRALDSDGKSLRVIRLDQNTWQIIGARALQRIEYAVDDSWERFDFEDVRPYRSSESHFDRDVFLLNPNAVFGYFRGSKDLPFRLRVQKEANLYGATSLKTLQSGPEADEFLAEDYRYLVDNPIMYAPADTASIRLEQLDVQVACYSNTGKKIADILAQHIAPLVTNQYKYLQGNLATDTYTFILYHNQNNESESYLSDGLEHNQSTVILIHSPLEVEALKSIIFSIASHEFFHTLLPLGLHSHEIADFDFNDPKFSKHLWLYEGTTEYFTIHMRIAQQLESLDTFLDGIESKIAGMQEMDTRIPFTELSKHVGEMPEAYMDVYLKGALINLCMDIRLRELSGGEYGIKNLVFDLMERYGKDRAFKDDELFGEMIEVSGFPQIGTFIESYIEGTEPLPLRESLLKVGFQYDDESGQITELENPTPAQRDLRKNWIGQ